MSPRSVRLLTTALCALLLSVMPPIVGTAAAETDDGGTDIAPSTTHVGATEVLNRDPSIPVAPTEVQGKPISGKGGGWFWIWEAPKIIERWMNLEQPPMCFAPGTTDSGSTGVVGLNSWAWICPDEIRDSTVGPKYLSIKNIIGLYGIELSAFNPGVLVDWGDGSLPSLCVNPTPVITQQPFVPYTGAFDALSRPGAGDVPSPSCGHFIGKSSVDAPGGTFTVTATSGWTVPFSVWIRNLLPPWNRITVFAGVVPWPTIAQFHQRIGEAQALNGITLTPGR
ncbi:hypothetical protein IU500_06365 [Nocardia terpenica]|uniref:Uncharacterized protein n=1 Tax=Nocardia terpenica TaxID=455432 RepID=A0A164JMJ1_9NOCA|nr:hypothetical protein [Nocardia terpenica]KZM70546.1 hypothetical protein AWN90_38830 [Nocardia terpenica]MBF6060402.1 hypothetical protein [Nocardia terpenica]MBF6103662.1 hypothetical protein [Nocardia terpenica]MBF6111964.1 hypothetical protein [Nocardia terpenica]MBF6117883.1 hypothetical protein [Nocardia terpenica]